MASKKSTVDFILEQISEAGTVSARKMFGEYAIYCNAKVVALVCDDQLFVKTTSNGKAFVGEDAVEKLPYPRARPHLLISGELWEDAEWLTRLITITARALTQC